MLRIFTSRKNPLTLVGFEPANFGSRGEHITQRPLRPTHVMIVWRCHQLLSGFLANGQLSRVLEYSHQSAIDKDENEVK